jgi:hypothetical protein
MINYIIGAFLIGVFIVTVLATLALCWAAAQGEKQLQRFQETDENSKEEPQTSND